MIEYARNHLKVTFEGMKISPLQCFYDSIELLNMAKTLSFTMLVIILSLCEFVCLLSNHWCRRQKFLYPYHRKKLHDRCLRKRNQILGLLRGSSIKY